MRKTPSTRPWRLSLLVAAAACLLFASAGPRGVGWAADAPPAPGGQGFFAPAEPDASLTAREVERAIAPGGPCGPNAQDERAERTERRFCRFDFARLALDGARALAAAELRTIHLPQLEALDQDCARELARWRGETLFLGESPSPGRILRISPAALGALATWRGEYLFLKGLAELTPAHARALAAWSGRVLTLRAGTCGAEAAAELARWPGAVLGLDLPSADVATLRALAQWPGKSLGLLLQAWTPAMVRELAQWPGETMYLDIPRVDADMAAVLAQWRGRRLELPFNAVTVPDGLRVLLLRPGPEFFCTNDPTPETAHLLTTWNPPTDNATLTMASNAPITAEATDALRRWNPSARQVHLDGAFLIGMSPRAVRRLLRWSPPGKSELTLSLPDEGLTLATAMPANAAPDATADEDAPDEAIRQRWSASALPAEDSALAHWADDLRGAPTRLALRVTFPAQFLPVPVCSALRAWRDADPAHRRVLRNNGRDMRLQNDDLGTDEDLCGSAR